MMRDVKDSYGNNKPKGARSGEAETRSCGVDRFSDLWRECDTFERSPSDKPLSCTGIGAARDHIDAPTQGTLRQRESKTDNFLELRHCVFAFRASLSVLLKVRQFFVTEVTPCRERS
jgi:hypothetical protein